MCICLHAKYRLFFCQTVIKIKFPERFSTKTQIANFMRIRLLGTELFKFGQTRRSKSSFFACLRKAPSNEGENASHGQPERNRITQATEFMQFALLTIHSRRSRATAVRWIIINVLLAVYIFIKQAKNLGVTGLGVRTAAKCHTITVILLTCVVRTLGLNLTFRGPCIVIHSYNKTN